MKVRAIYKDQVIAESEKTKQIEGNHYFPPEDVNRDFLEGSETQTICPWKGTASYYHVGVHGDLAEDAAWYYPDPKNAAEEIKNHVAFWKGVKVEEV